MVNLRWFRRMVWDFFGSLRGMGAGIVDTDTSGVSGLLF